jgi:hypothetical protein
LIEVPLRAGIHTLTVGGYLNRKTYHNEIAEIFFDDIIVQQTDTPVFFIDDFQDGNADGWVIINDSGNPLIGRLWGGSTRNLWIVWINGN